MFTLAHSSQTNDISYASVLSPDRRTWTCHSSGKEHCIFLIDFWSSSVSSNAFYFWTADSQANSSVQSFIICVPLWHRKPWGQCPERILLQCCLFYFVRKLKASPSPFGSDKVFFCYDSPADFNGKLGCRWLAKSDA